jgi:uncharacterized protein with von Willebrand factor type A (vWA) domain
MFLDFFYTLRDYKVPVSTREYLDLISVLNSYSENNESVSPERFYKVARSVLIKDTKFYDSFDLAYTTCFKDVVSESDFKDKLNQWLQNAIDKDLSEERKKQAMNLPSEELMKELQKRIDEQKERHDGGNKWIGTGGTSAFGHSGYNENGIRVGGEGQNRKALAVAGRREFKKYRTDEILDVRQIKVALKKLRSLKETGQAKINISKTIDKTCENAGEIEIVETKSRKNNLKLVLLMDVGGSMTPHSRRVSQLFSAAHQTNHFKEFKHFYFHNIFYDDLYETADMNPNEITSFSKLKSKFNADTRFIIVGDAYMAPYELFQMTGSMREFYFNFVKDNKKSNLTGIDRVELIKKMFDKSIWLNPEPKRLWQAPTISAVKAVIPMFELSVDGITEGIKKLI